MMNRPSFYDDDGGFPNKGFGFKNKKPNYSSFQSQTMGKPRPMHNTFKFRPQRGDDDFQDQNRVRSRSPPPERFDKQNI